MDINNKLLNRCCIAGDNLTLAMSTRSNAYDYVVRLIFTCGVVCLLPSLLYAQSDPSAGVINRRDFLSPPNDDHINTWWHWVDNNITREGIVKDLEAMKAQGISGATIINVNRFDGKFNSSNIKFNSPEWYEMFRFALQQAKRLKMTIGVQNCDGWSTSGGPWITPEQSMKAYVWRKTFLSGGRSVSLQLKKPIGNSNFYKDVRVIAYPSPKPNSFEQAAPIVTVEGKNNGESLIDGDPVSSVAVKLDQLITINFKNTFIAENLLIHLQRINSRHGNKQMNVFDLDASMDGVNFTKVASLTDTLLNETFLLPLPKTAARVFRITYKGSGKTDTEKEVHLSEIALLKNGEVGSYQPAIYAHQAKTVTVSANDIRDFYADHVMPGNPTIKNGHDVIDLTGKMQVDGRLNWDVPKGDWTIIRFGYTTTGKKNHPATKGGEGLECDKMDTAALNIHFKNFPQKLLEIAGDLKGGTFSHLLVDSWEALFQNWTSGFEVDFEQRRGYSIVPYLPVLCGEAVESSAHSEAFLHDFRKTIAELIEERYYKHLSDLCHRNGLKFYGESIYGGVVYPPLDVLRCQKYFDVGMSEFWAPIDAADTVFRYNPRTKMTAILPMHGAFLYNKPLVGSEAYTGFAMYSDSPWDIKLYGDNAFTEGVNRMVLHSYVHQPDERKPGLTLGMYGLSFNRHNTWWPYASSFFQEQARVQYVLQKGKVVSDVLVYAGDKYPYQELDQKTAALIPGVRFNYLNNDVLLKRITIKNGKILLDNESEFQLLIINDTQIEIPTLKRIAKLIEDGATIMAPRPVATLSLKDHDENNRMLTQLAHHLWSDAPDGSEGSRQYGKGRLVWGENVKDVLKEKGFIPDFQAKGVSMDMLMFIHKKFNGQDAYYVVNKSNDKPIRFEATFRVAGAIPGIWDVSDGSCRESGLYIQNASVTTLPIALRPKQSLFIVFEKGKARKHFIQVNDRSGKPLFPAAGARVPGDLPNIFYENDQLKITSNDETTYELISDSKVKSSVKTKATKMITLNGNAMVTLIDMPAIKPFYAERFRSLTTYADPGIKFYSGTAAYDFNFSLPADYLGGNRRIYIQLDNFGSTASIAINGDTAPPLWEPGGRVDITAWVNPGTNKLLVKVTNPWRNRLIGDLVYPESKVGFTTSPFNIKDASNVINKNSNLIRSGISTPVKILSIDQTILHIIN